MRSIAIREELTGNWSNHGIRQQIEYALLTAEISIATVGLNPSGFKNLKWLKLWQIKKAPNLDKPESKIKMQNQNAKYKGLCL